jgi:uncharacterized RDD family membrane protein YckC
MLNPGRKGNYAGMASRGAALVIDVIVVTVGVIAINWLISLPINFFFSTDIAQCVARGPSGHPALYYACRAVSIAWVVIPFVGAPSYFIFLFWTSGQTVGKYAMGLRVVRLDGTPMTLLSSVVRWFGYFVSTIPFGLGFLWVAVDSRRLALHDHLAHTCVIYAWTARGDEYALDRVRGWFRRGRKPIPIVSSAAVAGAGAEIGATAQQVEQALTAAAGSAPADGPGAGVRVANYDVVSVAVANYSDLEPVLQLVQDLVAGKKIALVSVTVIAKDRDGQVALVGVSDLADPAFYASIAGAPVDIHAAELERIERVLPADRFIVLVLLQARYAELLMREVGEVSRGLVRRHDLGDDPQKVTRPPAPLTGARLTSHDAGQ